MPWALLRPWRSSDTYKNSNGNTRTQSGWPSALAMTLAAHCIAWHRRVTQPLQDCMAQLAVVEHDEQGCSTQHIIAAMCQTSCTSTLLVLHVTRLQMLASLPSCNSLPTWLSKLYFCSRRRLLSASSSSSCLFSDSSTSACLRLSSSISLDTKGSRQVWSQYTHSEHGRRHNTSMPRMCPHWPNTEAAIMPLQEHAAALQYGMTRTSVCSTT